MTLASCLAEAARRFATTPAYVGENGLVMSYADLHRVSDEVAVGLSGQGVGEGEVVALALPTIPEYMVAYLATAKVGAVTAIDVGDRWGGGGRGLASTSLAHLGPMTKLQGNLRGGGTTFLMRRWSAGAALEMVARHRITALGGIPTQVALMLQHPSF